LVPQTPTGEEAELLLTAKYNSFDDRSQAQTEGAD
jgi:hypothetical protein